MENLIAEPKEKVLLISRVFNAKPELVFNAWKECEHLKKWWGPENFTAPECEVDFKEGGSWRICIRENTGTEFRHHGIYKEIIEPEKIVFTHEWEYPDRLGHETLVTVLFKEKDGKTEFTFHQAMMLDETDRENHRGGWNGCFDHLEEYLKNNLSKH